MATDDPARYRLQRKLGDLVGPDEAALLMTGVPPFPWAEVATKRDLDALETRVLGRIDGVRSELLGRIGEVRGELLEKIGALDSKIGALDSKIGALDSKIGALDSKIGALDSKIGSQPWKIYAVNFASVITTAGLVLAAVRLS